MFKCITLQAQTLPSAQTPLIPALANTRYRGIPCAPQSAELPVASVLASEYQQPLAAPRLDRNPGSAKGFQVLLFVP